MSSYRHSRQHVIARPFENAKCNTLSCGSGYTMKPNATTIACTAKTCNATNDRDTCCDPVGL